jgi:hypothetical protein
MDYFAMLEVARRPWLDPETLKVEFVRLSSQFHPDKVAPEFRTAATREYAELSAAQRCLAEPRDRLRHLLELETGAAPQDVQSVPPGAMDLLMEIGQACHGADLYLTHKAGTSSPLLQAGLVEKGMELTEKLSDLAHRIDARRDELSTELKGMNAAWESAPPVGSAGRAAALPLERLEQLYRTFSYMARWTQQIQERMVQLAF